MNNEQHENKSFIRKIIALVYVGEGVKLNGIPARDLTPDEVEWFGGEHNLRETGLYISQAEALADGGKNG